MEMRHTKKKRDGETEKQRGRETERERDEGKEGVRRDDAYIILLNE
jgi:hypothetical protein